MKTKSSDHLGEDILGLLDLSPIEPAHKAELQAHLATCAPCRQALDEYRQALEAFDQTSTNHEPSEVFDANLRARLDALDQERNEPVSAMPSRPASRRRDGARKGSVFSPRRWFPEVNMRRSTGSMRSRGPLPALAAFGAVGIGAAALIAIWLHVPVEGGPPDRSNVPARSEIAESFGASNLLEVAEFFDVAEDLSLYEDFGVVENFDVIEDLDVIESLDEGSAG
ncbi:MAG: hypothetical protein IPK13_18690 [Deltaproteobacteria bacterium]|nr:hypothetical protein [Deltaproteobacteria bacterium]